MKRNILMLAAAVLFAGSAWATVINVPADYNTINQAIDNAVAGDTVQVAPGTYTESVDFDGKELVVQGDINNPAAVVIDASGFSVGVRLDGEISSAAVLEGFTVDGATNNIYVNSNSNPTVRHCVISNATDYAIYVLGGSGVNLDSNSYSGNAIDAIRVNNNWVSTSVNLTNDGIPYHFLNNCNVWAYPGDPLARLTIDPGTQLLFQADVGLQVGTFGDRAGELHAAGTMAEPIVFDALSGVSGAWAGLVFGNGSDYALSESTLEWCEINNAGGSGLGGLAGIALDETQQPTISNCSITNSAAHAMLLSDGAHPASIANLTVSGNSPDAIGINGTTYFDDCYFDSEGVPYEVLGNLFVWDYSSNPIPRMTIAPGNTFQFTDGTGIQFGTFGDRPGELYAVGTLSEPIKFTSSSGVTGGWNGLLFGNGSDHNEAQSTMEYCVVEYAGQEGWGFPAGIISDDTFQPTISNSAIRNNDGYAVFFDGKAFATMTDNIITGNTINAIGVSGHTIDYDLTWLVNDAPYHVLGDIYVWDYSSATAAPRVTVEPGTTILFAETFGLDIGNISDRWGELYAIGTESNPITFGAINGMPGGWGGIQFNSGSDHSNANSVLDYCELMHGGHPRWNGAEATVSSFSTDEPSISRSTFSESSVYPVYIHSDAGLTLINNEYVDNAIEAIAFEGRTFTEDYTIQNDGEPYHVLSYLYVQKTSVPYPTLTIEPGTTLQFAQAAGLRIGAGSSYAGMLNAVGTESSPITFTSFTGTSGGWGGILFDNGSDTGDAVSTMDWCNVNRAGYLSTLGFEANMRCYLTSQPTISNSSFNGSLVDGLVLDGYLGEISDSRASLNQADGIVVQNSTVTQLTRVEVSGNTDDGLTVADSPDLIVGGNAVSTCQLYGNDGYNLRVVAGTDTVDAGYNYWGTLVPAEIEASIYDFFDDPALSVVDWEPAVNVGTGQNVVIEMTPYHTPTVIGPGGGYFRFSASIENQETFTTQIDAWSEFILPNNTVYGPVVLYENLNLPAGYTLSVAPFQEVPGYAPTGTYQFVAKIGDYPAAIDSASFEILKIELNAADRWFQGWNNYGWFGADDADKIAELEAAETTTDLLPTEFEVGAVYPNPFNAMANLRLALPEAAPVSVVVYNVTGQRVMTVASGDLAAGYHTLTVDGSRLASGLYFVSTEIAGHMNSVQRMVLMK
ncbi:T9SS type A sorting domain-containing protein [bacterium]|nr:T9SS type A sorting domain-containing protein [bacterium]